SYFAEHPLSSFGEAIRSVITAVRLAGRGRPPKKLLITSAIAGEGKTVIALSLARSQALAGYKVILLSADVRWPKVEDAFKVPKGPGLCEYLAGKVSFNQIIKKDKATGVHIIPAGQCKSMDIPELFNTTLMDELLDVLVSAYDSVIIDSPPVNAVSEARVLANKVDMTVFVVRWVRTKKTAVREGLQQLAHSRRLVGVLLSMVDISKETGVVQRYRTLKNTWLST
ncbi:MAG: CpsD/CapB family tyrosine-protein kinase, partial [Nitrososphaera sp.]|nr:CpsD/CapB family tyrosine-protein kinase [Nitrososphaera sp.]